MITMRISEENLAFLDSVGACCIGGRTAAVEEMIDCMRYLAVYRPLELKSACSQYVYASLFVGQLFRGVSKR